MDKSKKIPDLSKVWCVVPVYNNASTVLDVVRRCRRQIGNVLLVDDGSGDIDLKGKLRDSDIHVIRHETNMGKGAAIISALDFLRKHDAAYMITVDADGQHYPEDIPSFFPLIADDDRTMVIGCRDFSGANIPNSSRLGRRLSNFWMKFETGLDIHDCQSGYRAYPVKQLLQMKFLCRRYNFETEVLVRAAWAGLEFKCLPVRTLYPESHLRISHFRPWRDNLRISLIHFHFVTLKLLPIPRGKLMGEREAKGRKISEMLKVLKTGTPPV